MRHRAAGMWPRRGDKRGLRVLARTSPVQGKARGIPLQVLLRYVIEIHDRM